MATLTAAAPTIDELRAALSDPDALYEIVNGWIVEVPGMSAYAATIAERIWLGIREVAKPARLGSAWIETMFIIDPEANTRRRPDVAFVSADRWPLDRPIPTMGELEVVPDLAIEIVSPSNTSGELSLKIREYFRLGVRQVWRVEPETREIAVYRSPKQIEVFEDGDILDAGDILPGLRLVVADLFSTAAD